MTLSPNTQAILLLTARFSRSAPGAVKPLGPVEWGRFALWLKDQGMNPEILLAGKAEEHLAGWSDKSITVDRIQQLLDRGSALAIAAEKWLRSGLWILSRSDAQYPKLLKQRLQMSSPPILFGCGNAHLLCKGGIAVVGSRNASSEDLDYATALGAAAAQAGVSIVSGGARGIDEAAMLGALQVEGTAVGILADNLLRATSSQKYRKYLSANNLVLVSAYQPEAGFNAGNAMGRNKYIYCLSNAAVVVHSGRKGGTWSGALENLKKDWVPLWVKPTGDSAAGNSAIVEQGAAWAAQSVDQMNISKLLERPSLANGADDDGDLFAAGAAEQHVDYSESGMPQPQTPGGDSPIAAAESYDLFIKNIGTVCSEEPQTPKQLEEKLGVQGSQLNVWLKRALDENLLKKRINPVRYECSEQDRQQSFFPEQD